MRGKLQMQTLSYPVVLYPDLDEPGAYIVEAPDLPGLATEGATVDDALAAACEAIAPYIEELKARGEPPPQPGSRGPIVLGSVTVKVA
jgi:predicted RNase H-like HicB family nuclease